MILDQFKLDGRVAIITGAARGLGQGMALGIAEAGDGLYTVAAFDAVFNAHRHYAAGGEISALLFKLLGGSAVPPSTEEKEDGGALVLRLVVFGFEDMNGQFDAIDGLIDFGAGTGQAFGHFLALFGGSCFCQQKGQT